jgi:hypothetical protein
MDDAAVSVWFAVIRDPPFKNSNYNSVFKTLKAVAIAPPWERLLSGHTADKDSARD